MKAHILVELMLLILESEKPSIISDAKLIISKTCKKFMVENTVD